jgi:multiple sugar transport system permease protein
MENKNMTTMAKDVTQDTAQDVATVPQKRHISRAVLRENLYGYIFMIPWLLGFFGLFLGPGLASLYFSFTEYDVLSPPKFIGLGNYVQMFTEDDLFWPSLGRTFYYAGLGVPLGILGSMTLAILLNTKVRGVTIFRTLFFMPTLVPLVASVVLWTFLLNKDFGLVNQGLRSIGIRPPGWFSEQRWAIPSLIIMGLWGGIGGTRMIIFLAGLQGIPDSLYDAAAIDGAGWLRQTMHVTLPLLTPTIFFNLVLGVIGALQTFAAAFVATEGGPAFATWFFGLHLYKQAFDYWNMGYASALAWFFALVIISLTLFQQRLSTRWVFYYGGQ